MDRLGETGAGAGARPLLNLPLLNCRLRATVRVASCAQTQRRLPRHAPEGDTRLDSAGVAVEGTLLNGLDRWRWHRSSNKMDSVMPHYRIRRKQVPVGTLPPSHGEWAAERTYGSTVILTKAHPAAACSLANS